MKKISHPPDTHDQSHIRVGLKVVPDPRIACDLALRIDECTVSICATRRTAELQLEPQDSQ